MKIRLFNALALLALVAVVALTGCRKDEPESGLFVSIERLNYTLGSRGTTIKLQATSAPTQDLYIPYHVSGEAVRGKDYQLSDSTFVLKAGKTTAEIQLTRLVEGDGPRNFSLVLVPPTSADYKLSLKNFAQVQVLGKAIYQVNFTAATGTVLAETTFGIRVTVGASGRYRVDEPTLLDLEVDPSSTAVEGEHFAFVGGTTVTIPRRERQGQGLFAIRTLKVEEGHDKLVLRVAERDGFAEGTARPTLTLTLSGPENFSGQWRLKEWANSKYLEDNYLVAPADLITPDTLDKMTLTLAADGKSYEADLDFKDQLAQYFGQGRRTIAVTGERSIQAEDTGVRGGYGLLLFTGANLSFNAAQPERADVPVAFRLIPGEPNTKPELEVMILQYKPKAQTWADFASFLPDDTSGFIRLRFVQK